MKANTKIFNLQKSVKYFFVGMQAFLNTFNDFLKCKNLTFLVLIIFENWNPNLNILNPNNKRHYTCRIWLLFTMHSFQHSRFLNTTIFKKSFSFYFIAQFLSLKEEIFTFGNCGFQKTGGLATMMMWLT